MAQRRAMIRDGSGARARTPVHCMVTAVSARIGPKKKRKIRLTQQGKVQV